MSQEVLERHEQERTKPAPLLVGEAEAVLLQQLREVSLSQILCFGRLVSAPTNVCVKRVPVDPAERGQCFA